MINSIENDMVNVFVAAVLIAFTFIFFYSKKLKLKLPLLMAIILLSLMLKKELVSFEFFLSNSHVDVEFISFVFNLLYFTLILNIIYSYINYSFYKRNGEKTELIVRLFKMASCVFLIMCFGERFYLSTSGVITFGSVSGIIIGMASKAVLSNFISGIMLYFDKPFNVGDYILSPQDKVSGTVSKIGFRITTLINDEHKVVYIPNSLFSTLILINSSRAANKRIFFDFSITIEEYVKIPEFIEKIKHLAINNRSINANGISCFVNDITQGALNIHVSCFVEKDSYNEYEDTKNELILSIINLMEEEKISFCFEK